MFPAESTIVGPLRISERVLRIASRGGLPSGRQLGIWGFSMLLLVTALAGTAGIAARAGPLTLTDIAVFVALAPAFFAAETFSVHLNFRRNAHSVSLTELPLAVGLFACHPVAIVVAQVVGGVGSLHLVRRQPPIKLLFNLGVFAWSSLAAVLVASIRGAPLNSSDHLDWVVAAVGVLLAAATSAALVAGVISIAEGKVEFRRHAEPMVISTTTALLCTAYGLSSAILVESDPVAILLVCVPVVGLYVTNRSISRERRKSEGLALLYDASRVLNEHADFDKAISTLLANARAAFRVDYVAIFQLSVDGAGAYVVVRGPRDQGMSPMRVSDEHVFAIRQWVRDGAGVVMVSAARPGQLPVIRAVQASMPLRNGVLVGLEAEGRVTGLLALGNRMIDVNPIGAEDARLAQTLGRNLAVALQNSQLERALTELRRLQGELAAQARQDPLTGLANRRGFSERVTEVLGRERTGECAALFVDLDDFKSVNDTLGHEAGDTLLGIVAQRIQNAVGAADIVARLGGDEFAALLVGRRSQEEISRVAEQMLDVLSQPAALRDAIVPVNASIGVVFSQDAANTGDLLQKADVAMYAAKARGKRQFAVFDRSMHEAVVWRYNLQTDLQQAVARGEMRVAYQPLVDLRTGDVAGAEALVRWLHPKHGLLLPDLFIPLAAETGTIGTITRFVLEQSAAFAGDVDRLLDGKAAFMVAVNVSVQDLVGQRLLGDLQDAVASIRSPRTHLMVEITEGGVMVGGVDEIYSMLAGLREAGLGVALDDFGTGHSSLSRLRHAPVDTIKIDKQFVDDLVGDGTSADLVRAIVDLGHSLGLSVVGEGIESEEQWLQLSNAGCDFGQGFWISRPLEAPAFIAWLEERSGMPGSDLVDARVA